MRNESGLCAVAVGKQYILVTDGPVPTSAVEDPPGLQPGCELAGLAGSAGPCDIESREGVSRSADTAGRWRDADHGRLADGLIAGRHHQQSY